MQLLFAWAVDPNQSLETLTPTDISASDELITKYAPKWPISMINHLDLSILRLAFWELTTQTSTPHRVVIDEAIEIAKEFGNDSSPSFINGVLGAWLKTQNAQI